MADTIAGREMGGIRLWYDGNGVAWRGVPCRIIICYNVIASTSLTGT